MRHIFNIFVITLLIPTLFTVPAHASAGNSNVFYMQDDGTLRDAGGELEMQKVAKQFYGTHADEYDFLVLFTDFPSPQGTDWSARVTSNIQGLGAGWPPADDSLRYGSQGTLKDIVLVHDINAWDKDMHIPFYELLHELGHYWMMGIPDPQDGSDIKLSREGIHWSMFLDTTTKNNGKTYMSPLGGAAWRDNRNGTFTQDMKTVPVTHYMKFSDFELYLMGLLSPHQAQPSYSIVTNDPNQETIRGTKKIITINDLIRYAGSQRVPAFPNTQKNFKTAYLLFTGKNTPANANQIDMMNWIAEEFPKEWRFATRGLSTINNQTESIVEDMPTTPISPSVTNPTVTIPPPVQSPAITMQQGSFAYGMSRISLAQEANKAKLLSDYLHQQFGAKNFNQLFWKNKDSEKGKRWWYAYVNAHVYGGYPFEAIKQSVKFGGKTVNPTVPWALWKTTAEYKTYINR